MYIYIYIYNICLYTYICVYIYMNGHLNQEGITFQRLFSIEAGSVMLDPGGPEGGRRRHGRGGSAAGAGALDSQNRSIYGCFRKIGYLILGSL